MAEEGTDQPGKKDSRAVGEGDQKTGPLDEREQKPDHPEFKSLSSSNVVGYIYDSESKDLEIHYHGNRIYTYRGVPQDVADGLETAGSAGEYIWHKIRGTYAWSHGGAQGGEGGKFRGHGATGEW